MCKLALCKLARMANSPIPYRMRWWGWGTSGHDKPLTPAAEQLLETSIHMDLDFHRPIPDLQRVRLPRSAFAQLPEAAARLKATGAQWDDTHDTRIKHAFGRSYPDLVRLRSGQVATAPDAVLLPQDEQQLLVLLQVCSELSIAVVPFGGGTSVVGGVSALHGEFDAVIAVSMVAFDQIKRIDNASATVTVGAGVFGPDLEAAVSDAGFTVGHFPQSYEFSTVGGWVSCRSAGQESSGYGRIDANVVGLRAVTPAGIVSFRDVPASAAGPDPRQLFLGSEGVFGFITEVTLALHRKPRKMLFDTYFFPDFATGAEAFRKLEQSGQIPHMARLSDEKETLFGIKQMGNAKLSGYLRKYLGFRGMKTPCMAVFAFADHGFITARVQREKLAATMLRFKAARLSAVPGMMWVKHRFTSPYLRDVMMSRGVAVDTLETATTWSQALKLRTEITHAMENAGTPAFVFCHISHVYGSGCSLYFTYFFREGTDPIAQWRQIKGAASDAILAHGGTISHHHGVGTDHAEGFQAETGELYGAGLKALKASFDPKGIMNPGKLL